MLKQRVIAQYVALLVGSGWAAHPFVTDDAGTVAKGNSEIEFGSQLTAGLTDFGYGLAHGLTDNLDLAIGSGQCFAPKEEQEVHPVTLGLKLAVMPGTLSLTVAAPLAEREHALTAVYSHSFNNRFAVHANLGYTAEDALSTVKMVYALSGQWSWNSLEAGLELAGGEAGINWLQAGLGHAIGSHIRIDGGTGFGGETLNEFTGMVGMTFFVAGFAGGE